MTAARPGTPPSKASAVPASKSRRLKRMAMTKNRFHSRKRQIFSQVRQKSRIAQFSRFSMLRSAHMLPFPKFDRHFPAATNASTICGRSLCRRRRPVRSQSTSGRSEPRSDNPRENAMLKAKYRERIAALVVALAAVMGSARDRSWPLPPTSIRPGRSRSSSPMPRAACSIRLRARWPNPCAAHCRNRS